MSEDSTKERVSSTAWWPQWEQELSEYISTCERFQFWTNLYDMLGKKLAFSKAYHPQTDGLAERMIQTMEDIIHRFCAYGMEYKDHERYTHDWFTLLPAVQLA
ncbi:hypothetical protein O181_021259 [Austropuccinia psidii MF-1]|uniref:Integrase catalytic domain-containing protein n=1 Tax=Austropuccinia psidii MF-1 TaxID=1389203 RepID=A0A9Q3CAH0_9BASI|nr:hypothetical protein [Austropuccinia psidii MF-1]